MAVRTEGRTYNSSFLHPWTAISSFGTSRIGSSIHEGRVPCIRPIRHVIVTERRQRHQCAFGPLDAVPRWISILRWPLHVKTLDLQSEGRKYPISPVCTVGVISLNTPCSFLRRTNKTTIISYTTNHNVCLFLGVFKLTTPHCRYCSGGQSRRLDNPQPPTRRLCRNAGTSPFYASTGGRRGFRG